MTTPTTLYTGVELSTDSLAGQVRISTFCDTFSFQIESSEFSNDIHRDRARSSYIAGHWDRTGYRRDGRLGPGIQLEVSLEDGEVIREFVRSVECAHMSE